LSLLKTKDEGDVVSAIFKKRREGGRYNDVVYRIKISKHQYNTTQQKKT
jgi:hypothetical protein